MNKMRLALLTAAMSVPVMAVVITADPASPDIGSGPCSTAWKLFNHQGHSHSFGETQGYSANHEVDRDNSHYGAVLGQLYTGQHPYDVCDEGGDTLPD